MQLQPLCLLDCGLREEFPDDLARLIEVLVHLKARNRWNDHVKIKSFREVLHQAWVNFQK
jgi:hypothetical protein